MSDLIAYSERLSKLTAFLPGMVYQFRLYPDGRICVPYASEGISRLYRLSAEQVREDAEPIMRMMHPDDRDRVRRTIQESAETMTVWSCQFRVVHRTGEVNWLEARAQPEKLGDGSVLWHGFNTDITERRRFEQRLRESETRFRKMADSSPSYIWMMTPNAQMDYVNRTFLRFLGMELEDVIGEGWRKTVHSEDLGPAFADMLVRMESREQFSTNVRVRRQDGVYRMTSHMAAPWFDDDGNLGGYIASAVDVTDQLHAQQEVQAVRDQFKSILAGLPEVIYSATPDHSKMLFLSPSVKTTFGVDPESLMNNSAEWLKYIHPDDIGKIGVFHQELKRNGQATAEYRFIRPDGVERIVRDKVRIIKDEAGNPVRSDGIVFDITDDIHVEEQLRKARDTAMAASRHKSEFLASMSHEIRTPMTAIVGYAHLLTTGQPSEMDQTQWSRNLRQNADYLLNLLNDILDLSKIESGQVDLQVAPVDPWSILQGVSTLMAPRAKEKLIDFEVGRFGKTPRVVLADATRLKQVLVNLTNNAIKFTDKGSVSVEMLSHVDPEDGHCRLSFIFADTGVGIDPEKAGALFKPFSRLADPNAGTIRPGTGLGLVIAMRFARMMGGDITFESVPGQGSRFTATIDAGPAVSLDFVDDSIEEQAENDGQEQQKPIESLAGLRVLVTDDNVDNQKIIQFILEHSGAVTEVAGNGLEATRRLLDSPSLPAIDLVLMDMQMPVCDGYAATRILRSNGYSKPIIALTAYSMSGDRQKCLDAGCSRYLTKPVVPDVLVHEITKLNHGMLTTPARALISAEKRLPMLAAVPIKRPVINTKQAQAPAVELQADKATAEDFRQESLHQSVEPVPKPAIHGVAEVVTQPAAVSKPDSYLNAPDGASVAVPASSGAYVSSQAAGRTPAVVVADRVAKRGSSSTPISQLLGGDRFERLVREYKEGLTQTRASLISDMAQGSTESIRVTAHRLKGSGTSYGFPAITRAGAACEAAIKTGAAPAIIKTACEALLQEIDLARQS